MSFLAPLGLLLLLFVPSFLAVVLHARRRRPRAVASFHLFREIIDSLPVLPRSYFIRKKIQLFLLFAAVTFLALAAGRPLLGDRNSQPVKTVIVLDHLWRWDPPGGTRGASISPADEALRIIDRLRPDDLVMLARTDTGILTPGFVPPRKAIALLRRQSPSEIPFRPEAASSFLELLGESLVPDRAFIVTPVPGRWASLPGTGSGSWEIVPSGPPPGGPNLALLDVDLFPDLLRPGRMSIFLRAAVFGRSDAEFLSRASVSLSLDGRPLLRKPLSFGDDGEAQVVLREVPMDSGLLSIALEPADSYPGDSTFLSPLRSRPFVSASLVTTGNHPLESALRSLPNLSLSVSSPEDDARSGTPLVTVVDGYVPPRVEGNLLLIRPFRGLPDLPFRGEVIRPLVIEADETHFLLEGVSLSSLSPQRLPLLSPGPHYDVIARADGHPLILAGETPGGGRVAVMNFDPMEKGWIYTPSFPILVANLVSWLGSEATAHRSSYRVGESAPLDALSGPASITDPLGREHTFGEGSTGFLFSAAGTYRLSGGGVEGGRGEVFANLLDEDVSRELSRVEEVSRNPPEADMPERPFRFEVQWILLVVSSLMLLLEIWVAPGPQVGRLPE